MALSSTGQESQQNLAYRYSLVPSANEKLWNFGEANYQRNCQAVKVYLVKEKNSDIYIIDTYLREMFGP